MQCILGTPNALTMTVCALNVVLIFSLVTALSGLPYIIPVPTKSEGHTLPTDLQPPPLEDKEHQTTIFVVNLYAVKNISSNESEEMFQNEITEIVPDLLEPLATVLLVVENDEEEKEPSPFDLDEFANELHSQGYNIDKIDHNGKTKVLRLKLDKEEAQSMVESASKPFDETTSRQKRNICLKCAGIGGGGRGGYGGGHGGGYGGGGYPSDGGGQCSTCGEGGGYYPSGGGGSYYPPSGGGGSYYPPSGGGGSYYPPSGGGGSHYPSSSGGGDGGRGHGGGGGHHGGGRHRGCNTCGSGGGGGGSYAQAQSSASASAGSWGK